MTVEILFLAATCSLLAILIHIGHDLRRSLEASRQSMNALIDEFMKMTTLTALYQEKVGDLEQRVSDLEVVHDRERHR